MVSTHLKNISQIGSFPEVGVKTKNNWNHHLDKFGDPKLNPSRLPEFTENTLPKIHGSTEVLCVDKNHTRELTNTEWVSISTCQEGKGWYVPTAKWKTRSWKTSLASHNFHWSVMVGERVSFACTKTKQCRYSMPISSKPEDENLRPTKTYHHSNKNHSNNTRQIIIPFHWVFITQENRKCPFLGQALRWSSGSLMRASFNGGIPLDLKRFGFNCSWVGKPSTEPGKLSGKNAKKNKTRWWFQFNPFEKYYIVKLDHFPR